MYDKEYDERLLKLNEQFLAEKQRSELLQSRIHRIELLKTFQVRYILKALRQRWKMRNFSVSANNFGRKNTEELDLDGLKLCVYTCLVGDYDTLKEPVVNESNIDYIAFTDQNIPRNSVWTKVDITSFPEYSTMGPYRFNRLLKILPHKYLRGYDYSMYIDGAVIPAAYMEPLFRGMGDCIFGAYVHDICDCVYDEARLAQIVGVADECKLEKQIDKYRRDGMPEHYGIIQGGVLIRKHSDVELQNVMQTWWEEYQQFPTRDQISLPVAMWKNGFDKNRFYSLGNGYVNSVRFRRELHRGNPVFRSDV